jgi:hypothetical protein
MSSYVISRCAILGLGLAFFFSTAHVPALAAILQDMSEGVSKGASKEADGKCNRIDEVSSPVRTQSKGFKHTVEPCGKRAELAGMKTTIGQTYWYGWSLHLPADWKTEGTNIPNQWAAYPPSNKKFRKAEGACGAVGSYMAINSGKLNFKFQRKGTDKLTACTVYPVADIEAIKGKWVDFVMHVKWTGDSDGFLKLWVKEGDKSYNLKVDVKNAPTYWADEGKGPYYKSGLYKGSSGASSVHTLYTDEHRLGDQSSSFAEVAPKKPGEMVTIPQGVAAAIKQPASSRAQRLPGKP